MIGAGLSGLMAASRLAEAKFDVTLFEASDRVGGRVWTRADVVRGKVVEAGAELIGTNHPLWNRLAAGYGLKLREVTREKDYARRRRSVRYRLGDHDLTPVEMKLIRRVLGPVFDRIGEEARTVDRLRPWTAARASDWDRQTVAERLREPDMLGDTARPDKRLALRYLEFILANDQCAATADQSYLGLLAAVSAHRVGDDMRGYWEHTEDLRCIGGNQQLATELARRVPRLLLSAPVEAIELSPGKVRVGYRHERASTYQDFDYVILATPPAVWPAVRSDPAFRPEDYRIAHGPAVKHLSTFDSEFWERAKQAPAALWDRLGSVWDSTDGQDPHRRGPFGLTVYSGGPIIPDPKDYPKLIETLFRGYGANVRHSLLVDWPAMPWCRTGNSVPARGQVMTVSRNLSRPFQGRLFFAGEQASPGFFGYMEGALDAGLRAASQVAVAAVRTAAVPAHDVHEAAPVAVPEPDVHEAALATETEAGDGAEAALATETEAGDGAEAAACVPAAEPGTPGRLAASRHPQGEPPARRGLRPGVPQRVPLPPSGRHRRLHGHDRRGGGLRLADPRGAQGRRAAAAGRGLPVRRRHRSRGAHAAGLLRPRPRRRDRQGHVASSQALRPARPGRRHPVPPPARHATGRHPGARAARMALGCGRSRRGRARQQRRRRVDRAAGQRGRGGRRRERRRRAGAAGDRGRLAGAGRDGDRARGQPSRRAADLRRPGPGAAEIIGPATGARHRFATAFSNRHELRMEAVRYPAAGFSGEVTLTLRTTLPLQPPETQTATVRVAPWIIPNHLDRAERVYVVDAGSSNDRFRTELRALVTAAGCTLVQIPSGDIWAQDCMEFGFAGIPGKTLRTVLRSPRNRPLRTAVRALLAEDLGYVEVGTLVPDSSYDYGGNLETSPPVTVGGKRYPFGRIYYGPGTPGDPMDPVTRDFLASQTVQRPFEVDTSWLTVGHVDEVISFVPARDRKGFRLLLASPRRAYAILDRLAPAERASRMLVGRSLRTEGGPVPARVGVEFSVTDFLALADDFNPELKATQRRPRARAHEHHAAALQRRLPGAHRPHAGDPDHRAGAGRRRHSRDPGGVHAEPEDAGIHRRAGPGHGQHARRQPALHRPQAVRADRLRRRPLREGRPRPARRRSG